MQSKAELFELPVKKAMVKFTAPCILSQLVALIHSLADTFFVGQTGDPNQVAGLSLSFPIFMLLMAVGNLFGVGANSYISRLLGSKKPERAKNVSAFAVYGGCAVVAVLIAVLAFNMRPILTAIGASSDTYIYAKGYLKWVFLIGGIPTVFELILGNLLRSEGYTKYSSIGLGAGGIINTILDPIFIFGFKMGAEGAGIATFLANLCALLYMLFILAKKKEDTVLSINPLNARPKWEEAKSVLLVGFPACIIVILGSTANFILNRHMSAYGDINTAAFGIVQKIGTVAIQITLGITTGILPLLGYHYAAGNGDRVREVLQISTRIIAAYAAICMAVCEIFPKFIIGFFINDSATVATGVQFLRRWILSCPGMCFVQLYNAIFQSMGKWKQSLVISILRQAGLLIPCLLILDSVMGKYGLVFAQPIADTITLILGAFLYFKTAKPELTAMEAVNG